MTVDKIQVKNFQSIDKGEVELGTFTVFTGPSSSGKSAFLRASQALARNSFTPSQVRIGNSLAEVTMYLDGHEVIAKRGAAKSTYVLDGEEFTKAGRTVPDEIQEVFAMPQIMEVETTFATQFDKPYLIAEPGAAAAKVLGSLTNVSVLHSGLKETHRRSLEMRSRLKVKQSDRDKIHEDLKQFSDLETESKNQQELEESLAKARELMAKTQQIDSLLDKLTKLKTEALEVVALLQKLDLESLETLLDEVKVAEDKVTSFQPLLERHSRLSDSLPTWDYQAVPEGTLPGSGDAERLLSLNRSLKHIHELGVALRDARNRIKLSEDNISHYEHECANLLGDLEVCPLCNSQIGE